MTVYFEYAFLENFLLDGLLLYLALRIARGKIKAWRLCLAAAVGAGEALLFPVISMPTWCAYLVKILGGILLCVIAVSGKRVKTYAAATAAFFVSTFALGGLLTAAYSYFGIEYETGQGFLVERAPVALVFAAAGIFVLLACYGLRRIFRFVRLQKSTVECTLTQGDRTVRWKGLADSGNLLEFRGKGVCVCSAAAIFALFGRGAKEVGRIRVRTVNGEKESPVFECESLRVGDGAAQPALFTVGEVDGKRYSFVLHTA